MKSIIIRHWLETTILFVRHWRTIETTSLLIVLQQNHVSAGFVFTFARRFPDFSHTWISLYPSSKNGCIKLYIHTAKWVLLWHWKKELRVSRRVYRCGSPLTSRQQSITQRRGLYRQRCRRGWDRNAGRYSDYRTWRDDLTNRCVTAECPDITPDDNLLLRWLFC